MQQFPLTLSHRPAFGREDFMVSPCNENAVAMVDLWPDWRENAVAIVGPAGCGKTHIATVWQARSHARWLTRADLNDALVGDVLPTAENFIFDGVPEQIDGDEARAFFHLLNWVRQQSGHLLFTSRIPPAQIKTALNDLRSRLSALTVWPIEAPDDELLAGLLIKQFSDRQIAVSADVVAYLVPRIERSFDGVLNIVERLDFAALAEKRAITIPFIRRHLSDLNS